MDSPDLLRQCNTAAARLSDCAAALGRSGSRILASLSDPSISPQRRRGLLWTLEASAPLSTALEALARQLSSSTRGMTAGDPHTTVQLLSPLLGRANDMLKCSLRFFQLQRQRLQHTSSGGRPAAAGAAGE